MTALETLIAWGDEMLKQHPNKILSFAEAIDKAQELLEMEKQQSSIVSEDGYTIVEDQYAVQHGDVKQSLPRRQFELLVYLMKNKGRVISRQEMLRNVWEEGVVVGDRTIDVHICKIKRRFPGIPIKLRKCYGYLWQ